MLAVGFRWPQTPQKPGCGSPAYRDFMRPVVVEDGTDLHLLVPHHRVGQAQVDEELLHHRDLVGVSHTQPCGVAPRNMGFRLMGLLGSSCPRDIPKAFGDPSSPMESSQVFWDLSHPMESSQSFWGPSCPMESSQGLGVPSSPMGSSQGLGDPSHPKDCHQALGDLPKVWCTSPLVHIPLRFWRSLKLQGNPPDFREPFKSQAPRPRFGGIL